MFWKFNQTNIGPWINRGISLLGLQRYEDALKSFDRALEIQPNDYRAWANRGIVFDSLQRYEEAIQNFNFSLDIQPNESHTWNNRGLSLWDLGKFEEAVLDFDKALEIQPNSDHAWQNRGILLAEMGRYKEAIFSIDKALEIDPYSSRLWLCKANLLEKLIQYNEALKIYQKISLMDSLDIWAYYRSAFGLYYAESYELAIDCCCRTLDLIKNMNAEKYHPLTISFAGIKVSDIADYSYIFFYCQFLSYLKLGKFMQTMHSLKSFLLSPKPYSLYRKLAVAVLIAGCGGQLKIAQAKQDFDLFLRDLGMKR